MNAQEINEVLTNFHKRLDHVDELLLGTVSADQIISNALELCTVLSCDLPKENYISCHSTVLSYFAMLEKVMVNKMSIKAEDYNSFFSKTKQFPKLVPRVYVCLLIACASKIESLLTKIITMLYAISHPLRGILIRFTAISFFPRESPQFPGFAFENFREMTFFVPNLKTQRVSDISSWLSANVSMSIYKIGTNKEIIKNYFTTATSFLSFGSQDIAVSVIETIFESIDADKIVNFLEFFINFLAKSKKDEKLYNICNKILQKIDVENSFMFITKTSFSNDFKLQITDRIVASNNNDLIAKCAFEWPDTEVLTKIFEKLGHLEFSNLSVAPPHGSPLTIQFIKTVKEEIPAVNVRKILSNEIEIRSKELDLALLEFIEYSNYNSSDLQIIFDEPFIAQSVDFLKVIFFRMQKEAVCNSFLIKLINNSNVSQSKSVLPLRVEVCDSIESIIPLLSDEDGVLLVINHFNRFENISAHEIDQLEAMCVTEDVLLSLSYALRAKDYNSQADKILVHVISKDATLGTLDSRLLLYFKVLNYMISSKPSEELSKKIICHIAKVLESTRNSLYQISCLDIIQKWKIIIEKLNDYDESANIAALFCL